VVVYSCKHLGTLKRLLLSVLREMTYSSTFTFHLIWCYKLAIAKCECCSRNFTPYLNSVSIVSEYFIFHFWKLMPVFYYCVYNTGCTDTSRPMYSLRSAHHYVIWLLHRQPTMYETCIILFSYINVFVCVCVCWNTKQIIDALKP